MFWGRVDKLQMSLSMASLVGMAYGTLALTCNDPKEHTIRPKRGKLQVSLAVALSAGMVYGILALTCDKFNPEEEWAIGLMRGELQVLLSVALPHCQ